MRVAQLLVVLVALFAVACGGGDTKIKCTSNDDCHTDPTGVTYACDAVTKVCLRTCTDSTTCLGSQHCDAAAGVCRDGTTSSGGDPNAGDPNAGDPTTGD